MNVPKESLPCIPGYTWDDVAWLGNDGYPNYYVTRDEKVYNAKSGSWVKPDKYGSATLAYAPNKFRHVNIRKTVVKYFLIPELKKQGYVELYGGDLMINRDGKVYNTVLCQEPAQYVANHGYVTISYNHDHPLLHRLLAEAFVPNDDPVTCTYVNHKDGNKLNNTVANLEWIPPGENTKRAAVSGALSFAKLTTRDAKEIRMLYFDHGTSINELVKMYNVSRSTISNIIHGNSWCYSEE